MKYIDIDNWNRKHLYEFFKQFDYPHFNLTTNLDITILCQYCNNWNLSSFKSILFLTMLAVNKTPEFKYRMRENKVIEHDIVHPSFTVINDKDVFNFCTVDFCDDYKQFVDYITLIMEEIKNTPELKVDLLRDDLVYISCVPWINYTSISHPIKINKYDSIPRISWGKYFDQGSSIKLPYAVQLNHALSDAKHLANYLSLLQDYFNQPEILLNNSI